MIIRRGYCTCCWLAESDRRELEGLMAKGRLPCGTLRRFGVAKWQSLYHRQHLGRTIRLHYYAGEEWQRRKESARAIRRWQWKPGQSGNPAGRPKGAKDRKPRRRPQGIAAAIQAERQERAAKLERQRRAAIAEAED